MSHPETQVDSRGSTLIWPSHAKRVTRYRSSQAIQGLYIHKRSGNGEHGTPIAATNEDNCIEKPTAEATTLPTRISGEPSLRPFPPSLKFVNPTISCATSGHTCINGRGQLINIAASTPNPRDDNSHTSRQRIRINGHNWELQPQRTSNDGPINELISTTPAGISISGALDQPHHG